MTKCVFGGVFGELLTDLSKAFDYFLHNLFAVKLEAYGFQIDALNLVSDYLSNRKQKVKKMKHLVVGKT